MSTQLPTYLLGHLFTTEEMRAIFSDERRIQAMLDFEAALGRALARAGIVSQAAAAKIQSKCDAKLFSMETIAQEAALSGNLAIPLVKQLTALVTKADEKAGGLVHWGATSQDAIDTGTVLQLRDALDLTEQALAKLCDALARICETHKSTLVAGRTWLQQGPPVTLGLKACGWLAAIERHHERLREIRKRVLVLQFGGAVGTLAALGDKGPAVAAALADELKLTLPNLPWHSHRDRFAEVATTMGLLVGSLGKIARDLSLMGQTEVGEVAEPAAAGRGGSSTMPHKRNPVGSAVVLAASIRVPALVSVMLTSMVQEHERGLGGWHAEWETLPEICTLAAGALAHLTTVLNGLEIDAAKMNANLEITHGLIMAEAVAAALAEEIGRIPAHRILEKASKRAAENSQPFQSVLMEDAEVRQHLSADDIKRLLEPKNYTGSAEVMVDKVLAERQKK
ncbi:MAG: 3-carboxy-cis,cis-muconate cycloisomerase [Candidatus Acidiferrales bacterium]